MAKLLFDIVTAERLVSSEEVEVIVAPGIDGELALLPSHAPLMTILKPGEIRVVSNGKERSIAVSGGFLEVIGNKVTILADTAERVEEIDLERAEAAFKRAEDRATSAHGDQDLERALASMRRSQARLKVARRQRRGSRANAAGPPS